MPNETYTERNPATDQSGSATAQTGRLLGDTAKNAARALQKANAVVSTDAAANYASRSNIVPPTAGA